MKVIGQIENPHYLVRLVVDTPPSLFLKQETQWIYLTKHYPGNHVGGQSIGMGFSDIDELIELLSLARKHYRGGAVPSS